MSKKHITTNSTSLIGYPVAPGGQQLQPYYISNIPYSPEVAAAAEGESGLLDSWRLLIRHKKTILISAVAGIILGIAIGAPMTPVYRAHTSIEVLSENQNFMNLKQTDPTTTSEYSDDVSEEETQSQMMQGDAVLKRVALVLDPDAAKKSEPQLANSGWRSWVNLPEVVPPTPRQLLLAKAIKTLKVRVSPHTRLLSITADSTDPAFAATFLDTLVQEYIKRNIELRYATTQKTGDWLGKEINDARNNLQRSEDALQTYARNSGLIFTDNEQETNVATEKLQQLQQSLSAATADRTARQARFDLAKATPVNSLGEVLSDEGLQDLTEKISAANQQLADLSTVYRPEYSKVKRTKAQLDALQIAFDEKRADVVKKIENDYRQAARNEALLHNAYLAQEREVNGQDEKTIQYNILKRDVDSNRQLYDTMLQQMKQASIASALHASNVRVSDPAEKPTFPVFPNLKLNAAIGALAGAFFSIGFVMVRERADRTLQMPGDIKQHVSLAELGTIPSSVGAMRRSSYYKPNSEVAIRSVVAPKRGARLDKVELATMLHKSSLVAEAFRSCLTSILFVGENETAPKVLLFTSTQPGDGKTTVVANMGIALSEIRTKTLIIDADLRRPNIHKVFDVKNTFGLSDLLQGDLSDEDIKSLVQETSLPGLHVLPAGPATSAAAHLLHSRNFGAFIEKMKPEYDMILIDTPPMIQMTDARVVGRLSDAAILVARAGVTTRDALLAAKERFEEDHTVVLGSILNGWDVRRATGSYYYNQYQKYNATYGSITGE